MWGAGQLLTRSSHGRAMMGVGSAKWVRNPERRIVRLQDAFRAFPAKAGVKRVRPGEMPP